jgi:two-component system, OmpR family, sensor histidine kinase VicK
MFYTFLLLMSITPLTTSSSSSHQKKIKNREKGITTIHKHQTRIVEDPSQIIEEISRLTANSNELSTCISTGGLEFSYRYFFKIKKQLLEKQKNGKHKGIRYVTKIEKDNIELAKTYLNSGIQIRHVKNLPPMSFGVSDKEMSATIEKMEGGKKIQSLLISTEPLYIQHFTSIFEEAWKNGIDANERIRDIEAGVDLADIEVISSSIRSQELYQNIIKLSSKEILWIFPTTSAFLRQDKMGAIPLAVQASRKRNVKVKILVPANKLVQEKVQQLKQNCISCPIDVRYIEQMSETMATILVVDRKDSLVMELKNDSKATFFDAIGLSTYSNSKAGVLSYVSIFENLWKQSELYEQLKTHDRMQKEFIDVAAHELRTPIQPILGLTQMIYSNIDQEEDPSGKKQQQKELLEVVIRNAHRLQRLTEDILDVTRIESQNLSLKLGQISLDEIIINAINDAKRNQQTRQVNLLYHQHDKDNTILIQADKGRLNQVISNLISNAVKFTEEGTIIITSKKQEKEKRVIISVKDTGIGIHPEVLPRLFQKFATKSYQGTGLGLYISKSIVEAHGGKMWAENNFDGKGATFAFSIPLLKK